MYAALKDQLTGDLAQLRAEGLYKAEAVITTPQAAEIGVGGRSVLNLCANNYLGLADHPVMVEAARWALERWLVRQQSLASWPTKERRYAIPKFSIAIHAGANSS